MLGCRGGWRCFARNTASHQRSAAIARPRPGVPPTRRSRMSRISARWIALLLSPTLALVGGGAGRVAAQTQTPVVPAHEAPSLEPAAMDTLKRMSDLLKNAKSFTFTYRSAHEQVARTGQMVDFLDLSRVTPVRPNRL